MQTREPLGAAARARAARRGARREVVDDPGPARYPTPLDAEGKDAVYRRAASATTTRRPTASTSGCVADNLRKGAALNAVQIAEALVARGLL